MNTREKILKAALEFFLNNTYRDVSINDIVKAVGITKGGFYHHFNSKEELFSQVVEDFMTRYTQMFMAFFKNDTMDFKQRLDFIAAKMVEIYKSEEVKKVALNYDRLWTELKKHNNRLFYKAKSMAKECLGVVKELFEKEKQRGILRDDLDCEGAAIMFVMSLKGVALYSLYIEEEKLEKNINTFMEIFRHGIQAESLLK